MFAVLFEVKPKAEGKAEYLDIAARLKTFLVQQRGFVSIERFQSLVEEGKLLSVSFWEDEAAIEEWRNHIEHRLAQRQGKDALFVSYRIRVAEVVRDYSDVQRDDAPADSNHALL